MENAIQRYLEDAIAAEKSFETQLRGFSEEATNESAKTAFATHADETREQYERLTARLKALGGDPSTFKSMLAHIFNMAPKTAQTGHADEERTTQDLMMAYSVENAEVAMYESLIIAAEAVGDSDTVSLARAIQKQEEETAEKVWKLIGPAATQAYARLTAGSNNDGNANAENPIIRYLQDAEAAERNFEDALATFGNTGDQPEVRSLLCMMSAKAKTQYERLELRLKELGASRSVAKSILAHMLAFTPVSAQLGHLPSEKNTQHLMITFAAAAAEMAMYEALAATAEVAGDQETANLARQLQSEEKEDHTLAWRHLGESARQTTVAVMS
jgi:ferritin-like metal-binding protein YciE